MLALKNGKIYIGTGEIIEGGTILVEDGLITAVGKNIEIPAKAETVDLQGKIVMPGFIDAHCHVGIGEINVGWEGRDYNESVDPITPHMRAIDAINPEDEAFNDALSSGITALMTGPGSANVIGGESVVIKTKGRTVEDMILKEPAGMKGAFGENPKRVYGLSKKSPATRMAVAALLRDCLIKTQNYMNKLEQSKENPDKPVDRDLKYEHMARVLRREVPIKLHAHRADDIMTAIRIGKEFNLRVTLEHCSEGHKIAPEVAASGYPAIIGPTMGSGSKIETKDMTWKTPLVLKEAGVKFAIMTDHPFTAIQYLPLCASLAVKAGLPEEDGLKAITISAAEILEVEDRIGSIEKGKDADIVIWDGHPFLVQSKVLTVYINGEKVYGN